MQRFHGYGRRVHVRDEVASVWRTQRQTAADAAESFGVLMGNDIRGPAEDLDRERDHAGWRTTSARGSPSSFATPGHQRAVCGKFACSGGRAIYLGTWHTHPEPVPTPSGIDRNHWAACLRANPGRPLAFVLVGTDQVRVFVRARWRFRPLIEECEDHG